MPDVYEAWESKGVMDMPKWDKKHKRYTFEEALVLFLLLPIMLSLCCCIKNILYTT